MHLPHVVIEDGQVLPTADRAEDLTRGLKAPRRVSVITAAEVDQAHVVVDNSLSTQVPEPTEDPERFVEMRHLLDQSAEHVQRGGSVQHSSCRPIRIPARTGDVDRFLVVRQCGAESRLVSADDSEEIRGLGPAVAIPGPREQGVRLHSVVVGVVQSPSSQAHPAEGMSGRGDPVGVVHVPTCLPREFVRAAGLFPVAVRPQEIAYGADEAGAVPFSFVPAAVISELQYVLVLSDEPRMFGVAVTINCLCLRCRSHAGYEVP
jgi:hypothetical protein